MSTEESRKRKSNSEESLLVIYILRILKEHSSAERPLSTRDVIGHLEKSGLIDSLENSESAQRRVKRLLETLSDFYGNGCILKVEGKTKTGHKWYYDAARDNEASGREARQILTDTEIRILVDLVSASKSLRPESTLGIADKLLKGASISPEERRKRLLEIEREGWTKNLNSDLYDKRELIQSCIGYRYITFDYEEEIGLRALPLGWSLDNGACCLSAEVNGEKRMFLLDKIRNFEEAEAAASDRWDDEGDGLSFGTTLDNLFLNLPTVETAINERRAIRFTYLSYAPGKDRILLQPDERTILPHSLVFNDGKYYMIGVDSDGKVDYFRLDLMVEVDLLSESFDLSAWTKHVLEGIERAREIELHPFMQAGHTTKIDFLALESALDRVRDSFGISAEVKLTDMTSPLAINSGERLVRVSVRTTTEEAFRWALANADAVELISPQSLRDRLGRIAGPIHQLYTQTPFDRVRENVDKTLESGIFRINSRVDESIARRSFMELKRRGSLGEIKKIALTGITAEPESYLGDFLNTYYLMISYCPECQNPTWASRLRNTQYLELFDTGIEDISWASEMKELASVNIEKSPISDLSALRECTGIHTLHLSDLNIRDISFIESYKNLFSLNLVRCPIEDYSPLFNIPPLKSLVIDESAAERIDMARLREHHFFAGIEIEPSEKKLGWLS